MLPWAHRKPTLNDTGEEGLSTDYAASPNFGAPNVFMDPRRMMFGLRIPRER